MASLAFWQESIAKNVIDARSTLLENLVEDFELDAGRR